MKHSAQLPARLMHPQLTQYCLAWSIFLEDARATKLRNESFVFGVVSLRHLAPDSLYQKIKEGAAVEKKASHPPVGLGLLN